MKVYVLISDCGLNGPWIHGVYAEAPTNKMLKAAEKEAGRVTGYQFTEVRECELEGEA